MSFQAAFGIETIPVDGFGDVNVDGVQGFSQRWWGWWSVGGEQGTQQPVVQLGVEDRKPQPVAGEQRVSAKSRLPDWPATAGLSVEAARRRSAACSWKGRRNYEGRWWCSTSGGHVAFESLLERDALMMADFDVDVVAVAAQTSRIPVGLGRSTGRRITSPISSSVSRRRRPNRQRRKRVVAVGSSEANSH